MRTLLLSFGLLLPAIGFAQQYSIGWSTIAGGGGASTGGMFCVTGTIGQPDAGGPMAGGNYSLTGGFWSLISVVQTSGAPTLTLTHADNNVIVSWPDPSPGWTLQQNPNPATTGWSSRSGVSNNGTHSFNTLTSPTGKLFFRLSHP